MSVQFAGLQGRMVALPRHLVPRTAACFQLSIKPLNRRNGRIHGRSYCQRTPLNGSGPSPDAIVVLGGGLHEDGVVPPWGQRRLDLAADLWTKHDRVPKILLLGAGTPHKPAVVLQSGAVLHEATAYADYLLGLGIPAGSLVKECSSYDTVGNGYFSLVIHALPAAWRRLAIVTSAFHMPRSRAIFNRMYSLGSSTFWNGDGFALMYHEADDEGLFDGAVYAARVQKEAAAASAWERDTATMKSLEEMRAWLHATHLCYSVQRQHEQPAPDDPKLSATY